MHFYPRSPCGERPQQEVAGGLRYLQISIHALLAESDKDCNSLNDHLGISIHALLAESDQPVSQSTTLRARFLSTLSLRRATLVVQHLLQLRVISIHALLAESDFGVDGLRRW